MTATTTAQILQLEDELQQMRDQGAMSGGTGVYSSGPLMSPTVSPAMSPTSPSTSPAGGTTGDGGGAPGGPPGYTPGTPGSGRPTEWGPRGIQVAQPV